MKINATQYCLLILTLLAISSWGFHAHKTIHSQAIFTLPIEMSPFFLDHAHDLKERAVTADKRRYTDTTEACKHYIDLDLYGIYPFENIPRKWFNAKEVYTKDTLKSRGILPWIINWEYRNLVWAMDSGSKEEVLKHAADIGHYISDANVPLHTTSNYNGQHSNQKGIHALWESRIPENYSETYDYFVGKAQYIEDPLEFAWDIVLESNLLLNETLEQEKKVTERTRKDGKYKMDVSNGKVHNEYTSEFIAEYNFALSNMVERRLQSSIKAVGSLWYSAWIDAGQPNLNLLKTKKEQPNKELILISTPNRIHE